MTQAPQFAFRLDEHSGVPVYRQLIDQIQGGIASGTLTAGAQLPTVRQVAVDRAYRELEIRGVIDTQQGTGTFISERKPKRDDGERDRKLDQMAGEIAARAGAAGFTIQEVVEALRDKIAEPEKRKR